MWPVRVGGARATAVDGFWIGRKCLDRAALSEPLVSLEHGHLDDGRADPPKVRGLNQHKTELDQPDAVCCSEVEPRLKHVFAHVDLHAIRILHAGREMHAECL